MSERRSVFVTGGTSYMGSRLIPLLGPGHRWPIVLMPFYWLCERLPTMREGARRLGLVTLSEMLAALIWAVENPAGATRILEVPRLRELARPHSGG